MLEASAGLPPFDAVVLAGGRGSRLGGADKPMLAIGERTLIDRVLDALTLAQHTVVVGPTRPVSRRVRWVREDPPDAGPVHALAAGMQAVTAPAVAVMAADLPFLDAETVHALRAAARGRDGALLVDSGGREQLLTGVWATTALRDALLRLGPTVDRPVRQLRALLDPAPVRLADTEGPPPWYDCDTPEDLDTAADLDAARRWT